MLQRLRPQPSTHPSEVSRPTTLLPPEVRLLTSLASKVVMTTSMKKEEKEVKEAATEVAEATEATEVTEVTEVEEAAEVAAVKEAAEVAVEAEVLPVVRKELKDPEVAEIPKT